MHRSTRLLLAGVGIVGFSLPSTAAEKLYVQTPAVYDPNAGVAPKVREECAVEAMVAQQVLSQLKRSPFDPILPVVDIGEAGQSKALALTIVRVAGVGGGGWSGAKGIDLRVTLFENGKEIDTYKTYQHSRGGVLGPAQSTCSILEHTAAAVGADVAKWLSRRSGRISSSVNDNTNSRDVTEEPAASKTD